MVKTDDLAKKSKSKKSSNKKKSNDDKVTEPSPIKTKKRKTGKKKHKVKESDDDYELPNPAFECPDENVEQALSASFIEVYEKRQQSKIFEDPEPEKKQVATKQTQKKSKSNEKSCDVVVKEKKAVKRKQNKENEESGAKKQKAKETSRSAGKKRKQDETVEVVMGATDSCKTRQQKKQGNIKVETGTIRVEAGVVNDAQDAKKQKGVKKRKVSTVETEEHQTKELETDIKSQTEGQILLSVGNMPSGCNEEALNFFFNESDLYPQISLKKKSVTIENEKGDRRRRNVIKGPATLICKSQAEADAILKLDGVTMTSVTGEESEVTICLKQSADPLDSSTKLFVGALHPKIPEAELQEALEGEGINLVKVKRACWKGGKRPKRYGFIWLPTPEDVAKALAAQITMEGNQLVFTHCKQ